MKGKLGLECCAAALFVMCGIAKADDIVRANNQFSVDFAAVNFGYKEVGNGILGPPGAPLDTEHGWVPGVSAAVSVMQDWAGLQNLYLMARYSYYSGHTNYVGASLLGGGGFGSLRATDGATVHDIDARLGKGFALGNVMVTPFVGLGYQNWDRSVNTGEDYSHAYYGGGLLLQVAPMKGIVLSADGLIGQTFASNIDARPIPLDPIGFNAALGDSVIYKAGLSADYAVTQLVHVNAGMEYENFKYGMYCCNAVAFGEPNSRTSNLTFRVGAGIAFGGGSDSDWGSPLK